MIGYKDTYLTTEEIFQQISYIGTDNIIGSIILGCVILGTIAFILYIYPILSLTYKYFAKQRQAAKRKLMIKQIAMQREIDEEIAKEL